MKILITGIHGFVGQNLVKILSSNYELYGLSSSNEQMGGVNEIFTWDQLDKGEVPTPDAILHLAGKAHDTKNLAGAEVYFQVNTELTKKIFKYFSADLKIKKFIFFSSVKAAADKVVDEILTEDVTPTPVGPYGESKIKAENYILHKMQHNPEIYEGREVIILRPCMIHGPGNKGNLNLLYTFVNKGLPWPLGAFENKRSFLSIDNLSFVISGLLNTSVENGIYNIADDRPLSTNELIQVIYQALGKKAHIWKMRKGLIKGIAKIGDSLHLPLNTSRLDKLTENYVVSNQKIKSALNIKTMPVNPVDGISATIKSFSEAN